MCFGDAWIFDASRMRIWALLWTNTAFLMQSCNHAQWIIFIHWTIIQRDKAFRMQSCIKIHRTYYTQECHLLIGVTCSCSGENIQTICTVNHIWEGDYMYIQLFLSSLQTILLLLLLLSFLSLFSFPTSLVLTNPFSHLPPLLFSSTLLFLVHKAKGPTPPKELKKLPPAIQPTSEYWGEEVILQTASYFWSSAWRIVILTYASSTSDTHMYTYQCSFSWCLD